jgi:hypothetical protein
MGRLLSSLKLAESPVDARQRAPPKEPVPAIIDGFSLDRARIGAVVATIALS